ncbi:hypothetical protein CBR_g22971 [Chara braunii]|uniref:Vacuolar protein 14 C-terminal Fig4-binding domain-containing protein n=1 Tax=Chara braunii TaxID=69332 RepID=A0A388L369_CHABU|nr:hypothetical protein CBR_g22971 [Chara braunii]|eukprot:GBG76755.1 hypothetical protein CBR_g22971 [Chara braunii]
MADVTSLLSTGVLRNLSDKAYEKRKNAALEVESVVKTLANNNDHERISHVITVLINDFAISTSSANHRKGGLIGLAAATVGLAAETNQHLERIVPPVLKAFADQDSRVRYYACEALYNIAKVARGDFIVFFNEVFDALCKLSADTDPNVQNAVHLLDRLVKDIVTESDQFSIEQFIPLLRERLSMINPYVRQFLVGWITVLDSVPEIDMLGFLPDFLDGLFNMLTDSNHEIRQQADTALSEFLAEIKSAPSVEYGRMAEILVKRAASNDEFARQTAMIWISEFVKLAKESLVPYYDKILGAVLPCISDREDKIRLFASETNSALRDFKPEPADGFDVGAVLTVARKELEKSEHEATRLEALQWIAVLLERHRTEVLSFLDVIFPALLQSLSDNSDEVVMLVLEVQACIARDTQEFRRLMVFLMLRFNQERGLLERRGSLALRRLCALLDAERVYRELAQILEAEADLEFASIMVQALNLILLTATELAGLRALLKQTLFSTEGKDLFNTLYPSWCHSPVATISVCLLSQAYSHASAVISSLGETDIDVNLLVQLDKLVQLLETPIFAYLRLQLLDPSRNASLMKTLYGILMLLPQQSNAFKILRTRLKSVPTQMLLQSAPPVHPPEQSSAPSAPVTLHPIPLIRRASPAQMLSHESSQAIHANPEDGSTLGADLTNGLPAIHFAQKLKQFDHTQAQHRAHRQAQLKAQVQSQVQHRIYMMPARMAQMQLPEVQMQNGQRADEGLMMDRRGRGHSLVERGVRGASRPTWRISN